MKPDEPPLYRASQEDVMAGYVRSKAFRNKDEQGQLHMFFSPKRVPLGLTNQQIRICLYLARHKEEREKALRAPHLARLSELPEYMVNENPLAYFGALSKAHMLQIHLPEELWSAEFITEERFNRGVAKLIASLEKTL